MQSILVLGGTNFIGRNLVEELLVKGNFDITLFNRQQTNAELFSKINNIKGDRESDDIIQLSKRSWDCVIDLSCYYSENFEALLHLLEGHIKKYIFISSTSAYRLSEDSLNNIITEDFETLPYGELEKANGTMETYGNRKAECERILLKTKWLDKIILRPSIVYGKYDSTDRLYYWLYRIKKKLTFILPNNGADKITLTYVNDLVKIIIKSIELKNHSTIYNATTHCPLSLKEILESACKTNTIINLSSKSLLDNNIKPEFDIPLWFNSSLMFDNNKLANDFQIELKLYYHSMRETMNYFDSLNWPIPKAGLDIKTEKELIEKTMTTNKGLDAMLSDE
ncbi:MAG TPA: NAD-dependent epimerase/dehydratase family protein [Chitinophagaceae bacterium]